MNFWSGKTHREQNDGHGQGHGSEHSQSHAEDENVVGVDPAVGMQKFGLDVGCDEMSDTCRFIW